MIEIKFTLDASTALIGALQDLAGAIRAAAHTVTPLPPSNHCGLLAPKDRPAGLREGAEKDGTAEKAPNLPSEAPVDGGHPETRESVEEPKKRKPRAKKAPSESDTPVAPAVGDNSSPVAPVVGDNSSPACACAEPGPSAPEETPAEPEPGTATEPAHVEEAPSARAEDPLAGKGQTGEILAELTRKAIGDLDALGVDRGDANRRIRDYCARNDIKFPTFPALLQAVGYAEAIAICKGA